MYFKLYNIYIIQYSIFKRSILFYLKHSQKASAKPKKFWCIISEDGIYHGLKIIENAHAMQLSDHVGE